jgi:zinc protease
VKALSSGTRLAIDKRDLPLAPGRVIRGDSVDIPFTKEVLSNGLQVIVHEDRTCPIVAVNIWYHVGSKDERPGRTGFAHLFEHLMFEGSAHHDSGYFAPLQLAGGSVNGSTNTDRTNYWEVVPTNALELALWMESDRMGYLLPALTQEKFDNQREVVLNERRQSYENRPYGMANMAVVEALFPSDHPYHWTTIGSPADLREASLQEVRGFFETHYHPANASIALAGDIGPEAAIRLVAEFFGEIPPGPGVEPVGKPRSRDGARRLTLEDRVELPRLYLNWQTPAMFEPGDAEFDLLGDVLGNGKTSRLYRRLVYERRIATEVAAFQNSHELDSYFQIVATAVPGVALDIIEQAILEEVASLADRGPASHELERSVTLTEAHFIYRIQTVGGFGGKSDQLNAYNVYLGDPGSFDRDLERYRRATPATLQAAANRYLSPGRAVTLSVVPRGQTHVAAPASELVVPL